MTTTVTHPTAQKLTPMMAQWQQCKQVAKDSLLLFRMGDFYEAFYDDAEKLASELNLTLTKRQGVPMSGVPVHTCESYVDKLVSRGFRVAIAEQMEDPKQTKGIVKRDVTRVVTPGTVINSSLLSDKGNNFFAAIAQVGSLFGLAFLDLTTGEFRLIEFERESDLNNELHTLQPAELLTTEKFRTRHASLCKEIAQSFSFLHNTTEEWHFDHQTTYGYLINHFKVHSLDCFGLKGMVAGINAAGALLDHIENTLRLPITHIRSIQTYSNREHLTFDRTTLQHLELTESMRDRSRRNTLLNVLDRTRTPMGGRLLQTWIKQPLLSVERIHARQEGIEQMLAAPLATAQLCDALNQVRDLERLMMKISTAYATPRDLVALRVSLEQVPQAEEALTTFNAPLLTQLRKGVTPLQELTDHIARALNDVPPLRTSDGNCFREGFHQELDELRAIQRDSKEWISNYQHHLREQTGIRTLKVGYTRAFGYYIDVSKAQADRMPDHFQRRQTLVNNERYISPELKGFEEKVLTAEERIQSIEATLFLELRQEVAKEAEAVLTIARTIAQVDCLLSLTEVARDWNYVRPEVDETTQLQIVEGRHPVIESSGLAEAFVPNDTLLDENENQLLVITGPNMAGKSTYIRQVALITIMAQIGSFVPAKKAHIGVVDRVFTRIGASDDLSRGQSTFMVEMSETANILHHATDRSLVILDEIGRGTSTYDGISIAWSVAEYLLTTKNHRAKTLFATHYWELTQLEEQIPGAVNYNIAVKEVKDEIIFLRKIVRGDTDKSYGIQVGRLAGLPSEVITRAKEILAHLEKGEGFQKKMERSLKNKASSDEKVIGKRVKGGAGEVQLLLFEPAPVVSEGDSLLVKELRGVDTNTMTPMEALLKLAELQSMAKKTKTS